MLVQNLNTSERYVNKIAKQMEEVKKMHLICASDFCKETRAPLKLVRRLCREGKIPYVLSGRSYMMDREEAEHVVRDEMTMNADSRKACHRNFNFMAAIRAERSQA